MLSAGRSLRCRCDLVSACIARTNRWATTNRQIIDNCWVLRVWDANLNQHLVSPYLPFRFQDRHSKLADIYAVWRSVASSCGTHGSCLLVQTGIARWSSPSIKNMWRIVLPMIKLRTVTVLLVVVHGDELEVIDAIHRGGYRTTQGIEAPDTKYVVVTIHFANRVAR